MRINETGVKNLVQEILDTLSIVRLIEIRDYINNLIMVDNDRQKNSVAILNWNNPKTWEEFDKKTTKIVIQGR